MVEMQLGFLVMAISDGSCLVVLIAASCEMEGLPTDTSVSPPYVAAAGTAWAATTAASRLATKMLPGSGCVTWLRWGMIKSPNRKRNDHGCAATRDVEP